MERFGKYFLLDKIATGGMAEVYLAKLLGAEGINKFIGIKRILPQYSQNEEFITMFKEEAKIAVNISHANVVPIYDFGEENSRLYLVMEYVPGKNLRQLLNFLKKQGGSIPIEYTVAIINEVAKGLDHAHKCFDRTTGRPLNIIHRDISPQNIMLSFDGEVKLLDFGIAKAESKIETTRAGTLKGKFGYMSPEQAEDLELDARTDIFSLGIVMWEILADSRLFMANNVVNTIRKIRECHIPPLSKINSGVTEELQQIVNKALARDRNLRYQSAGELHKDLNRYLNKHFHDFSQQDLSTFMKKHFHDEIVDLREKMIEYSLIGTQDETSLQQDFDEDKTRILDDAASQFLENSATFDPSQFISNRKPPQISEWQDKKVTHIPRTAFGTSVGEKSNFLRNSVILVCILFGAYFYIQSDSDLRSKWNEIVLGEESSNLASKNEVPVVQKPVEPETYSFHVTSNPPGAAIHINGQETGFYTPGRIKVAPNSQFSLSLRKDGYFPYTQRLAANQNGQQFKATLQRAQFGFVSVSVHPGQADLYINGQKLSEAPPLKRYAVPANERIHIRAYNPTTGASAEKTIKVKQDTHQQLSLFLKRETNRNNNDRAPSNF